MSKDEEKLLHRSVTTLSQAVYMLLTMVNLNFNIKEDDKAKLNELISDTLNVFATHKIRGEN